MPANSPTSTSTTRSPNFPSIGFPEALERAKRIYEQDRQHATTGETAAKHWGLKWTGQSKRYVGALRAYGLLDSHGKGGISISDSARKLFVLPDGDPERAPIIRELALKPQIFRKVLDRYGTHLPSRETLIAKLILEWGFASENAAGRFIDSITSTLSIIPVDPSEAVSNTGGAMPAQESPTMPPPSAAAPYPAAPQSPTIPPHVAPQPPAVGPAPPAPGFGGEDRPDEPPTTPHAWTLNLGGGVAAVLTVRPQLTPKQRDNLKKQVELWLEIEAEDVTKPGSSSQGDEE